MPVLGITENGDVYETDSSHHESSDFGKGPRPVNDAQSTLLLHPAQIASLAKRTQLMGAAKAAKQNQMMAQRAARNILQQRANEAIYNQTIKRQRPYMSGSDQLIANGVNEMIHRRNVNFDRLEVWNSGGDFGTENDRCSNAAYVGGYGMPDKSQQLLGSRTMGTSTADFDWQRPSGNPITGDGTCGPVTDYEIFCNKMAEAGVQGSVPAQMNSNSHSQFLPQSSLGRTFGDDGSDGSDDGSDDSYDVGPPPEEPPDPMAPPADGSDDQSSVALAPEGPPAPPDSTAATSAPSASSTSTGFNTTSLLSLLTAGATKAITGSAPTTSSTAPRTVAVAPRAPMSTNTMLMIGGAAVLGLGLLVLMSGPSKKAQVATT